MPTRSEKQVLAAAEKLVHSGVNTVLVKMGAKGSAVVGKRQGALAVRQAGSITPSCPACASRHRPLGADIYGNVVRQEALPVLEVLDTTGAGVCLAHATLPPIPRPGLPVTTTHTALAHPRLGDCFTGAYSVAMLEGKPPSEALRFASAAAACCVARHGAMPSMPTRCAPWAVMRGRGRTCILWRRARRLARAQATSAEDQAADAPRTYPPRCCRQEVERELVGGGSGSSKGGGTGSGAQRQLGTPRGGQGGGDGSDLFGGGSSDPPRPAFW